MEFAGVQRGLGLQDGHIVQGIAQDCSPIVEHTKALHSIGDGNGKELKFAASIPLLFIEKYLADNNITMYEFSGNADHKKRLLNDPALAHFRVWKGRI